MMTGDQCDSFPDIFQKEPKKDDPNYEAIHRANEAHRKVYQAAGYILTKDFRPDLRIPHEPKAFPGNCGDLPDEDIAMVAAVIGMLLADNWDPTMGKSKPSPGDLLTDAPWGRIVVDRRFVDATVVAVKEYTSKNRLFNHCFQLLRAETAAAPAPGPVYEQQIDPRTTGGDEPPGVNP